MDTSMAMDVDDLPYAKLFGHAPIYDLIFSCLSPRSLVRFALTCRAVYSAAASFRSRAFNINHHFSRYFSDPLAFRSLQAKTNSLVSGSNALQYLDRVFYPEADLDLYVHPGHALEVARFLVEAEGYRFAPRATQEQDWKVAIGDNWDGTQPRMFRGANRLYPLSGINGVWTFEKTNSRQECLKVQIIEATSSPVEAILEFHSTVVMNFVSSDAAYALYPIATFEERSTLGMPSARESPLAVNKYVGRGWRFYFLPLPDQCAHPTKSPFFLDMTRWVGDKHTWVLPLDQTGVKARPPLSLASAPLTFDPSIINGWILRPNPLGVPVDCYETHSNALQSTIFRYNYAIPDEELWCNIRAWVHRQGKCSHRQLSKEDWVWFDADLPSFLVNHKSIQVSLN